MQFQFQHISAGAHRARLVVDLLLMQGGGSQGLFSSSIGELSLLDFVKQRMHDPGGNCDGRSLDCCLRLSAMPAKVVPDDYQCVYGTIWPPKVE
ncbi:hypothetical protein RB195_005998 [Necator americanus]|uniref:Uncharacterized protein n=1 Tax=Necator americanus TaxID=51031 RepID=A0ABR1BSC7_NECAM